MRPESSVGDKGVTLMNWMRHWDDLNDLGRQGRNYNYLSRCRGNTMYWMRYSDAASTGGGNLQLQPSGEIGGLLNILGETMSSSELTKLFVWSFARIRNP